MNDDLAAARGILFGLVLSIGIWIPLIISIWK